VDNSYVEYSLPDGRIVGGTCPLEIVEAMAETKFVKPRSRASYRTATAKRAEEMYKVDVDASSDETFIAGMQAAGLLTPID
jgi:hypothetical protein